MKRSIWSGPTWSARPAGPGFFPLDDRLGLVPGQFGPFLVQVIVRLGTVLPFEQVPDLLALLTGVRICADTVRRITEGAGSAQVAIEERELARLEAELPPAPARAPIQQMSADGAMVPLLHGEWAEVRTVAVGTLDLGVEGTEAQARDLRYFSRLCSAHAFIREAALPLHQCGLGAAECVVAVVDGAAWLQEFIDAHCPDAVRILDFPHAVSYLAKAAQAAFGSGTREASVWLDTWAPKLKTQDPAVVLAAIRALPMPDEDAEVIRTQVLGYLTKRRGQLAYATFAAQGYPLGSGMIESANKLVVEARLKGSGMHWARHNVTPMLALRGVVCSGQWEIAWPAIWGQLRRQETERRRRRHEHRRARREQACREDRGGAGEDMHVAEKCLPPSTYSWHDHPYDPVLLAKAKTRTP